jgi:hypothetical protein
VTDEIDLVARALREDGAAVARGIVPLAWVERMRVAIEAELAAGSPTAAEYGRAAGRFYGDFWDLDGDGERSRPRTGFRTAKRRSHGRRAFPGGLA